MDLLLVLPALESFPPYYGIKTKSSFHVKNLTDDMYEG